jgi:anti-sigma28 factor (negative regulator of flagellin synthesis)
MKIGNSPPVTPPDPGQARKIAARPEPDAASTEDRVELSGAPAASASDPSRSARIEELRVQVEQGTYHVPAEDIAHGIVDDMLDSNSR